MANPAALESKNAGGSKPSHTPVYDPAGTIVAIATPPGGAARGIVRLSGPHVLCCLESCFVSDGTHALSEIQRPTSIAGSLNLAGLASRLPCDVYLWPIGRSYTRECVAEIHTLGSPPLLQAVLDQLCAAGARIALPGEFTLRAFLAGRMDLTQAEAVLGVIDARSSRQLEIALTQLAGGLANPLHALREALLDVLSQVEAGLDFAHEELDLAPRDALACQLAGALETVQRLEKTLATRSEATASARVVLTGSVNVGKSSLLNALAGGPAALVSDRAGTTRDYVVSNVELGCQTCELIDTAGVQAGHAAPIDELAAIVASEQTARADLRLLCLDSSRPANEWELEELRRGDPSVLLVLTKVDLPRMLPSVPGAIETSSATGKGLDSLRTTLCQRLLAVDARDADVVPATAARCGQALARACECLSRSIECARAGDDELVAAELRCALTELGNVAGATCTDDVLDRIFSRFCIGK